MARRWPERAARLAARGPRTGSLPPCALASPLLPRRCRRCPALVLAQGGGTRRRRQPHREPPRPGSAEHPADPGAVRRHPAGAASASSRSSCMCVAAAAVPTSTAPVVPGGSRPSGTGRDRSKAINLGWPCRVREVPVAAGEAFSAEQRARIDHAVASAQSATGLRFALRIGELDPEPRLQGERLLAHIAAGPRDGVVLILVSPGRPPRGDRQHARRPEAAARPRGRARHLVDDVQLRRR